MKNLVQINTVVDCETCNIQSFFCYSSIGSGCTSCPLCGNFDLVNYNKLENVPNEKYYFTDKGDIRLSLSFCPSCKIMYKIGCLHNIDQNAYNGHLISKWIDLTTNEEYCGMPQFQDENEWFEKANNIKILEFVCPNGSLACHNKKSGICHDIIDMNDKCKNNK